ncbi:hypothetical protein OUZ56_000025 [Daphnia magna]|uniref:Uncharacterized protein n=1 Tax=Daphnia magna TaxID=35525 RepID=A0ABQ9ZYP7_9CRUS|nr:hypothetical protein OUZ56_000025 [Daphnia magna]
MKIAIALACLLALAAAVDQVELADQMTDLDAAENRYGAYGGFGGYGGYGGRGGYAGHSGYGGYGGNSGNKFRFGRSVEEDVVADLKTAENHRANYGGYRGGISGNYGGYRAGNYGGRPGGNYGAHGGRHHG